MDSFNLLKRRTTELFNSIEHSLPSLGSRHGSNSMKGTWEKIQIPPLPRSSHSADIVAGTLYIFGGEVEPRRPVDNDMHAITLPSSGAQADYYAIKAKPAKPSAEAEKPAIPTVVEREPTPEVKDADESASPAETPDDKHLSEVSLTTPSPGPGLGDKGKALAPAPHPELSDVPPPRVGHATAVIGHRIFLFGGRGGPDMAPLDEAGRVWVFDTRTHLWSFLDPRPAAAGLDIPHPAPRSYHAAVATPKPDTFSTHPQPHPNPKPHPNNRAEAFRSWALGPAATTLPETGTPQHPIVGAIASRATDADADGYGSFLIHGGCLADSVRASDVWSFDVRSRVWQRLPDAPGPSRGGAALALSRSRLYRFGGFDGEQQQGGQLDWLELGVDRLDDQVTGGVQGGGGSVLFGKEDVGYKEVDPAPRPEHAGLSGREPERGGLEAVTVGGGREYLVLAFGEREASATGHEGAGRFWDDVRVAGERGGHGVFGRGEEEWRRELDEGGDGAVDDEDDASAEGPGARGWAATATWGSLRRTGLSCLAG
ncbi:hypothetical protein NEMBOFW57_005005 [Staphylotrichum longicolle]|uniref:Kelch repeat-containing protein n=1 Tax=Staphylotrichum longicolle TaxID=669026 RepID=A0AAD4EWJ0_9PEZI|nr:hypothetical protein NEMBOFW57_005005 [Staphylotrichum longicolle]